uniref:Uncharacterized protein n=1 Tax=Meloidogyne enterolobii TaxID=390850 RepID=A0A6V7UJB2_MELEN|nr:unnamed protein product [Meloidogyne enterolobii]
MILFNLIFICFEENNCMINGGESNKGKEIESSSVGTEIELEGSIEKSGQLGQVKDQKILENQKEEYDKNVEELKDSYRNISELEEQQKLNEKKAKPKDKQKVDIMSQMYQLWLKEVEENKKRKMSEAGPSNANANHSNQLPSKGKLLLI